MLLNSDENLDGVNTKSIVLPDKSYSIQVKNKIYKTTSNSPVNNCYMWNSKISICTNRTRKVNKILKDIKNEKNSYYANLKKIVQIKLKTYLLFIFGY